MILLCPTDGLICLSVSMILLLPSGVHIAFFFNNTTASLWCSHYDVLCVNNTTASLWSLHGLSVSVCDGGH